MLLLFSRSDVANAARTGVAYRCQETQIWRGRVTTTNLVSQSWEKKKTEHEARRERKKKSEGTAKEGETKEVNITCGNVV